MESCIACSVMEAQSCWLCCFRTSSTLWAASRAWWGRINQSRTLWSLPPVSSACFMSGENLRQRKSLIREQNNAVCGTEADEHARWSKLGSERETPCDATYMWTLNYDTDGLSMKQSESWTERADRGCRGGEEGAEGWLGVWNQQMRTTMTMMYRGDKRQVLLCSTRNYIHYLGRNHNGKGYKKQSVYRYRYRYNIDIDIRYRYSPGDLPNTGIEPGSPAL